MGTLKIISGGQTGVDQGALDFALKHEWPCGGWCPPGRECERGIIPVKYPVMEVKGGDYQERTRRNVRDADAILVITWKGMLEPGTDLTLSECRNSGKPFLHLDLPVHADAGKHLPDLNVRAGKLRAWLDANRPSVLNVAGNRESASPGIQAFTCRFLELVFFGDR